MSIKLLKKLMQPYIWKRLLYERLSEPIHLNLLALFVGLFGSYRQKIDFDLVIRQQHAYALLNIADQANALGLERVSVFEFGVAAGAGLLNLQEIASKLTTVTGIGVRRSGGPTRASARDPRLRPAWGG